MMRYYQRGVQFVHRARVLYAIAVVLAAVSLIPTANILIGLIGFVYTLLYLGYYASIPALLQDIQNATRLTMRSLWSTTRHNTARLVPPFLLAVLSLAVAVVVLAVIIISVIPSHSRPGRSDAIHWQSSYQSRLMISLLFALTASPFAFTSIFFSVEMRSLFRSMLQSLQYARRHLDLLLSIVGIEVALALVASALPTSVAWFSFLRAVLYQYVALVILATALLHYQDHRRREWLRADGDHLPPLSSHT